MPFFLPSCPVQTLCFGATAASVWFSLVCIGIVDNSTLMIYISGILAGTLINASMPLFLEAAVEVKQRAAACLLAGALAHVYNVHARSLTHSPLSFDHLTS